MELVDLQDTKGAVECELFKSAGKALRIVRRGLAATTAASNGAINFWRDDNGNLRGERMRFMVSEDLQQFQTEKAASEWLRTALALIK